MNGRVPTVLQMNTLECGAACLSMVLGFHGHPERMSTLSERLGIGRDGVSARSLLRVARSYGLTSRAYRMEPPDLHRLDLPAILHWQFKHYVVLERVGAQSVTLIDPAFGRRTVSIGEVGKQFTGVALTFVPTPAFERRAAEPERPFELLVQRLRQVPGLTGITLQLLAATALMQGAALLSALLLQVVVDRVIGRGMHGALLPLGLAAVAAAVGYAALGGVRTLVLAGAQVRVDQHLMQDFVQHLLRLPHRFFSSRPSGDLLMRLSSNAALRDLLTGQLLTSVLDSGMLITFTVVLAIRSPTMALAALAVVALYVVITVLEARPLRELSQLDAQAQAATQSQLLETLQGIATVKASGAEQTVFQQWNVLFGRSLHTTWRKTVFAGMMGALLGTLRFAGPLGLLLVGTQQVLDGQMSVGTMLSLNALAVAMLAPVSSLATTTTQVMAARTQLERLNDVLTSPPEPVPDRPVVSTLQGAVELRDVSYSYDQDAPPALRNISLRIEAGQFVALVGASGSGKSSLLRLLLGLAQPSGGTILFDGIPVNAYHPQQLRQQLGSVLQESSVFSGTIYQNIAFGRSAVTLEEAMQAARQAALANEIQQMPMGYFTRLSEGGFGLSGGQRQRLALARALVGRPRVLLLDEATSQLDTLSEAEIQQHLSHMNCTRIVAAHRLATIRQADLIVVLQDGRLVESGTHTELLSRSGPYAALMARQHDPTEQDQEPGYVAFNERRDRMQEETI